MTLNKIKTEITQAIKNGSLVRSIHKFSNFQLLIFYKGTVNGESIIVFEDSSLSELKLNVRNYFTKVIKKKYIGVEFVDFKIGKKYYTCTLNPYKTKSTTKVTQDTTKVSKTAESLDTHIVIVYDESGSMRGMPHKLCNDALVQVLKGLQNEAAKEGIEDKVFITMIRFDRFNDFYLKNSSISNTLKTLSSTRALQGGSTNIDTALISAYNYLVTVSGNRQIFLFTDGEHNDGIYNRNELVEFITSHPEIILSVYASSNSCKKYLQDIGVLESNMRVVNSNVDLESYNQLVVDAVKSYTKLAKASAGGQTINSVQIGFFKVD